MSTDIRDARAVSRALFGNAALLEVMRGADRILGATTDKGTVTTRQVAAALGISDSVVRPVMLRLVEAGLLKPLPKVSASNGPQLFARWSEPAWVALRSLADELAGVPKGLR